MTIWGGIVLLLIGAVPFLAYPWIACKSRQKRYVGADVREATNLQIFEDQIRIYKSQLEAGELTSKEHLRLVTEAELILLDDTYDSDSRVKTSGSVWILPVLCLFLISFSLGLYRSIGALEDEKIASLLEQYAAQGSIDSNMDAEFEKLYMVLEKRAQHKPQNVFYWTLLGEFALSRSEIIAASQYFAKASELDPENAYLLMQRAQTLFLADKGNFTERVRDATNKAFEQDPDNKVVLRLKGIDALSRGKVEEAIFFWEMAGVEFDDKMLPSTSTVLESGADIMDMRLKQ